MIAFTVLRVKFSNHPEIKVRTFSAGRKAFFSNDLQVFCFQKYAQA